MSNKLLTEQELRIVTDHPHYGVTNDGKVYSYTSRKWLKQHSMKKGYMRVGLSDKGKTKIFLVHRLVAREFVENIDNKPHVNHIDNDRKNNNASNLEWVTNKENNDHMLAQDRHHKTYDRARMTHCLKGHELTVENTYVQPNGIRSCRTCKRDYNNKYRRAQNV